MLTAKEFLILPSDAPTSLVTERYRTMALEWHPDKNDAPNAEYIFKLIAEAYELAKRHDERRIFPALRSLNHRMVTELPHACECGWFFENEFLCESCGAFVPGLRISKDAPFPVRERFWKIARRVCLAKGYGTDYARQAYAYLFGDLPVLLGRRLQK